MRHPMAICTAPRFPALAVLVLGALLGLPGGARAQGDYAPDSRAWNGLSELRSLASAAAIEIDSPARLDLSRVSPNDAILLVYPTVDLPTRSLGRFLRAGGRVALADDFGRGTDLLSTFGIRRTRAGGQHALHLRGNPNLPVAEPAAHLHHPLTSGVRALLTNHPATLAHPELQPLIGFPDGGAVVLVGAVGDGRLVAISDPSVLINNMLGFRGNRAFASNLLRYLEAGRGGRIWLVTGATPIVGRFGRPDAPLPRVQGWLDDIASADAPPMALTLGALLLVALFVLVATSSLPRRSPYRGSAMLPAPAPSGGFVGRVDFFRRRPAHLLHPLMVYKFELEGELVRRLGLRGRPLLRDVLRALRTRGVPDEEVDAARQLITELDRLREQQDRPGGPPRIRERQLRRMVETGERVLAALGGERTEPDVKHGPNAPEQT